MITMFYFSVEELNTKLQPNIEFGGKNRGGRLHIRGVGKVKAAKS